MTTILILNAIGGLAATGLAGHLVPQHRRERRAAREQLVYVTRD